MRKYVIVIVLCAALGYALGTMLQLFYL